MARAYRNYAQSVTFTSQTQAIPGREAEMVANDAGGVGFVLDDWERLNRFLIIGSEGGTYYTGEQKLTEQNAAAAIRCIKADGVRVVEMARDINVNNRAPKVDQQLFVLALAMKHGDAATKSAVRQAAPRMLRTGTHLLHFVAMLDSLGGWNRSKRKVIQSWFCDREPDALAFQCLKYVQRDGWSQRDALRVAHVKPETPEQDAVLSWVAGKVTLEKVQKLPSILIHHSAMNTMDASPVEKALWGIQHNLPREALPTEALSDLSVQAAMLPATPIHALIRNLGNFTASGVFGGATLTTDTGARLTDKDILRRARVHPFAILLAALVYRQGRGVRGAKTWVPNKAILSALEDAYDLAFDYVEPTNKKILVAIDVSGSMSAACMGTPIPASTAAAAMAVTLARLEPNAVVVQFDTAVQRVMPITKRTGVASLESHAGGGTDVSSPVFWAMGQQSSLRSWRHAHNHTVAPTVQQFDAFVILTDAETWAGKAHPAQALEKYRRQVNRRAKLVCCAMTAGHANIVDPNDPLQFGCAGLDGNLPALVSEFIGR